MLVWMRGKIDCLVRVVLHEMVNRWMIGWESMWAGFYLEIVVFLLVSAPNCIIKTIVIGNESDALVGVVLEAVVWLL